MTAEFEPTTWHRSAYTTCENNRGTQIRTDGRRTAKIRKDHVATVGYTCNKGPHRAIPPRRSSRSTTACDPATRPCPTAGLDPPAPDGEHERTGVALNTLTDLTWRDPIVGTPWHEHIPA